MRSGARAVGNTKLWEQQPNFGMGFTPWGRGSMETRPARKKRMIRRGMKMVHRKKMVEGEREMSLRRGVGRE